MNALHTFDRELDVMNSAIDFAGESAPNFDQQFKDEYAEFVSSYYAGKSSRYLPEPRGIQPLGSGADFHYRNSREFYLMAERAHDDDRNNMVVGSAIDKMVSNVMQTGFGFNPDTGDRKLDIDIKAAFCGEDGSWANDPNQCDYECEHNLNKKAELALRARTVAGDQFHFLTSQGNIQTKESHHVRNPFRVSNTFGKKENLTGIVHGVQHKAGKRVAFHTTPETIHSHSNSSYSTRAMAARDRWGFRQVLQTYDPKRSSQRRGITSLAPIVFTTKYHDDLQFAALVNAKRQSWIAILRETPLQAKIASGGKKGSRSESLQDDGTYQTNEGAQGPGNEYRSRTPGEKLQGFAPTIPGAQFGPHVKMLLTFISINLDLPLLVLMLDASEGNFSNYRAVMDQAQMRFIKIQEDMRVQFHTPVYQWWLRRELNRNPILMAASKRAGINIFRHRWKPKAWKYIQPLVDITANELAVNSNQKSLSEIVEAGGIDFEDHVERVVSDRSKIIKAAMKEADRLNTGRTDDEKVNWRELAFGTTKAGTKLTLSGTLDNPEVKPADPMKPKKEKENDDKSDRD